MMMMMFLDVLICEVKALRSSGDGLFLYLRLRYVRNQGLEASMGADDDLRYEGNDANEADCDVDEAHSEKKEGQSEMCFQVQPNKLRDGMHCLPP